MPEFKHAAPKYVQIADHIRTQISRGELQPGDEVPSERQLAADWSVARPTATKALELLRVDGIVESQLGRGTFVRGEQVNVRARDRYQRSQRSGHVYLPGERAEIVSAMVVGAPVHVLAALGLNECSRVIQRGRVISNASGPVELSTSWFAGTIAEQAPAVLDHARIPMGTLAYLESATGRKAAYAVDQVSARLGAPTELETLGVEGPVAAVLVYRHTVYDEQDEPLEFVEAIYPPDTVTLDGRYEI
ncbi:MAG TPA: GntR family transcriptional regulator [Jatrophihabitantaceae bacterium]|nr:GntR family transcriptional regulator [Jatrophihabitantaceae bacterium]